MADQAATEQVRPPIPGSDTERRQQRQTQAPTGIRRVFSSLADHLPSRRTVAVAGGAVALTAAGAVAAIEANNILNPEVTHTPAEIMTTDFTVGAHQDLLLEPHATTRLDLEQGKIDTRATRDQIVLEGHNLAQNPSFNVENPLIVDLPSGDRWVVVQGATVNGETHDLFVPLNSNKFKDATDPNFVQAVKTDAGFQGKTADGRTVITPDKVEEITFPASK